MKPVLHPFWRACARHLPRFAGVSQPSALASASCFVAGCGVQELDTERFELEVLGLLAFPLLKQLRRFVLAIASAQVIVGTLLDLEPRRWRKPRHLDARAATDRLQDFKKRYEP